MGHPLKCDCFREMFRQPQGSLNPPLHILTTCCLFPSWCLSQLITIFSMFGKLFSYLSDSSRPSVPRMVATSHMWLCEFKLSKIKIQLLSCTSRISSAQKPHVAGGCCLVQCRNGASLSQNVLSDSSALDRSLPRSTQDSHGPSRSCHEVSCAPGI